MYQKRLIADLLFGVQLMCGVAFGGAQILRMFETTEGVNISWFVCWEVFLALNLTLAVRAYRVQPGRAMVQTIASYTMWTVLITTAIGVMLWNRGGAWDSNDTVTIMIVGCGAIVTIVIAIRNNLGMSDPMVRGWIAMFCRAIPQLALAWKITVAGSDGLSGISILAGHITMLTRLGQLICAIREAGWDRNRKASAISELASWGSWIIVTIIWLLVS